MRRDRVRNMLEWLKRWRRRRIEKLGYYLLAEQRAVRRWYGLLYDKNTYGEASLWFAASTESALERKALRLIKEHRTA